MSPKIHLVVFFVFDVNQEHLRQGESKILLRNISVGKLLLRVSSSYNNLLGSASIIILSKIHDGALLQK